MKKFLQKIGQILAVSAALVPQLAHARTAAELTVTSPLVGTDVAACVRTNGTMTLTDDASIGCTVANIASYALASNSTIASLATLTNPHADRIVFWDDSAGSYANLVPGDGLAIVGTRLNVLGTVTAGTLQDGNYGDVTASGGTITINSGVVSSAKLGTDITTAGKALLTAANAGAQRTALGLVIGTNVQAYSSVLDTYTGIAPSANVQTLLGATNYAAFKTSLGLNNVENTALSTWPGSGNITTTGTLGQTTISSSSAPSLLVSNTTATGFIKVFNALAPNMTTGEFAQFSFGQTTGVAGGAAEFAYIYDATNPSVRFGIVNNSDIMELLYTGGININTTLQLGTNNLTMTGSIGATGARVTKGWFTDLQVTNAIAASITGSAPTLTTTRSIYGNNFDGSAALAQIIASTFGGTGNGFTKFTGPASTEKSFALPNASATILTTNAAVTAGQGGTGVANTATLTLGSSNVNLATLGTGIIKNTTTTGAFTDAVAADVVTLFSACSGTQYLGADGACHTGGTGTVTSVTFTGDGIVLSSTPSAAVTASGTVTAALANAGAGTVLGNATGSVGAPSYTATPVLGLNATTAGTLGLANGGALGTTVTLKNLGATSAYNFNLPTTAGSAGDLMVSGGGVATSMTWLTPASGIATFLATPTSANLAAAVTDELGSGKLIFAAGTLAITSAKTLTVSNTITLAGTDGTTMTFPSTTATLARTDAANTFTGHQTIEGVTSTGATGTGKFVFDTSPTLATPTIGVATATSINKMAITAPATSSTLAVANGKTATISNTLTFTGTDSSSVAFTGGGTVIYTAANDTLTGGFLVTSTNSGTKSSGTFTPVCKTNNMQFISNGGAFTLAPPSGDCTMVIQDTNSVSAGAITTSGFTKVTGDTLDTTSGHAFMFYITILNTKSVLNVVALQ